MPLTQRFTGSQVQRIVAEYDAGESATSIARRYGVAPSALLRLLSQNGVVVQNGRVSDDLARKLIAEHAAGMTLSSLESRYRLSHGAVFRALHRFD